MTKHINSTFSKPNDFHLMPYASKLILKEPTLSEIFTDTSSCIKINLNPTLKQSLQYIGTLNCGISVLDLNCN